VVVQVAEFALDPHHMKNVSCAESCEWQIPFVPENHVPISLETFWDLRLEFILVQLLRTESVAIVLHEFGPRELGSLFPFLQKLFAFPWV